jgi:hypothetical protein
VAAANVLAATRPPETNWYRPTSADDADSERAWNSSILGTFDPWTKEKVTILAQFQTFQIEGKEAEGKSSLKDASGNEQKVTYAPITLTHPQTGLRLEWGNWAVAWAGGTAKLESAGKSMEAGFNEVTLSRGFGATVLYDFGLPDVRIGISWPEIYLRAGWSSELRDVSPEIQSMTFVTAAAGVSFLGLRVTAGDLFFGEIRVGHFGAHAISRQVTYQPVVANGDKQDDYAIQTGTTFDWLPTFRIGIAL